MGVCGPSMDHLLQAGLPTLTHLARDSRISPHFTRISRSHAHMEISHGKKKEKKIVLLLVVRGL